MDHPGTSELERRVGELEARLAALERIAFGTTALVRPAQPPTAHPTPPPVIRPREVDLEEVIGARVLPWVGALALIGGLATLASYAIRRGWLTDPVQFGLGLFVALVFLGLGLWREAKADRPIGPVLTAVGSVGISLMVLAGQARFDFYSGAAAVAALAAWGVLNVAFAGTRGTAAFAGLGLVGCFAAAALAAGSERPDHTMAAVLAGTGILSASAAAAVRRWDGPALVIALGALLGAAPFFRAEETATWILALLALFAPTVAYARSSPNRKDPSIVWPPVAAGLFLALFLLLRFGTLDGDLAAGVGVVSGLAAAAAAVWAQDPTTRRSIVASGLALALVASPIFLSNRLAGAVWLGALVLGALGWSAMRDTRTGPLAAWISLTGLYTAVQQADLALGDPWPAWLTTLSLVVPVFGFAAARLTSRILGASDAKTRLGWAAAAFLGFGCVNDFAPVLLGPSTLGLTAGAAWTAAMAAYGIALLPAGVRLRAPTLRYAAFTVLGLTVLKFVFEDLQGVEPVIGIGLLLGFGIAGLLASYLVYLRPRARRGG